MLIDPLAGKAGVPGVNHQSADKPAQLDAANAGYVDDLSPTLALGDAGAAGPSGDDTLDPAQGTAVTLASDDAPSRPVNGSLSVVLVDEYRAAAPVATSSLADTTGAFSSNGLGAVSLAVGSGFDGAAASNAAAGGPSADLDSKNPTGSGSSHHGGGGGGGTVPAPYKPLATNNISFVINFDSSVANAPSAFAQTIEAAVDWFRNPANLAGPSHPITVTLDVGWGEVLGSHLSFGALGESETYLDPTSYGALYSAMSSSSVYMQAPGSSQVPNGNFWVPTAEEKALGLGTISRTGSNLDGGVGFSSSVGWTYNNNSTVTSGTYDLYSVAQHEISETMGRLGLGGGNVGSTSNSYSPFDMFRYSSSGQLSPTSSGTAYFSYDNGVSSGAANLNGSPTTTFNDIAGGDISDWASSAGNDAFNAFASSGVKYSTSTVDMKVLDVLGYGNVT